MTVSKPVRNALIVIIILCAACLGYAAYRQFAPRDISVTQSFVLLSPEGDNRTIIGMTLHNNTGKDDTLTRMSIPFGKLLIVDLKANPPQKTPLYGGDTLDIPVPAHGVVTVMPDTVLLAVSDLSSKLVLGDKMRMDLEFAHAGKQHIKLPVLSPRQFALIINPPQKMPEPEPGSIKSGTQRLAPPVSAPAMPVVPQYNPVIPLDAPKDFNPGNPLAPVAPVTPEPAPASAQ